MAYIAHDLSDVYYAVVVFGSSMEATLASRFAETFEPATEGKPSAVGSAGFAGARAVCLDRRTIARLETAAANGRGSSFPRNQVFLTPEDDSAFVFLNEAREAFENQRSILLIAPFVLGRAEIQASFVLQNPVLNPGIRFSVQEFVLAIGR
jgi:hypothetical protein